jgi:hypothetical protein
MKAFVATKAQRVVSSFGSFNSEVFLKFKKARFLAFEAIIVVLVVE